MNTKSYNRNAAISYAKKWALARNPEYYNFDVVGGDCTSFVSQCYHGDGDNGKITHPRGIFY